MDFTIALRRQEAERAEALQARLQLQDITLYKCEADGAGPPLQTLDPVRLNGELDTEVYQHASGINFEVTLRVMCDDPAFHIHATFLARYQFGDRVKPTSRSELEAFRRSHAVLAVWPYMREFIHTVAARMGFPSEPLPLLRLVLRNASGDVSHPPR